MLSTLAAKRRRAGACERCGCTEFNACVGGPVGTCFWVRPGLCSQCATRDELTRSMSEFY